MDVLGVFPHTHTHTQASRWTHEERHLPWDQDQYRNEVVTLPSLSPRPHSLHSPPVHTRVVELYKRLRNLHCLTLRNNNNNNYNINYYYYNCV
ncbi:hypothetical protein Pcinc_022355 [Petrolisthes cinctipes]|uniref:Uncharacterized protein n=1 Tax=Petrolisthes cinctipes TaxID=88211 RepID=A0AAE1KDU0_PETCI|nr:hypothetical protein Pcinc_022355 [Petrolisthes cinctipes]